MASRLVCRRDNRSIPVVGSSSISRSGSWINAQRSREQKVRYFSRRYRCIAYSACSCVPYAVPEDAEVLRLTLDPKKKPRVRARGLDRPEVALGAAGSEGGGTVSVFLKKAQAAFFLEVCFTTFAVAAVTFASAMSVACFTTLLKLS